MYMIMVYFLPLFAYKIKKGVSKEKQSIAHPYIFTIRYPLTH